MAIESKLKNQLVYLVSFFSWSGYNAGLAIVISMGLTSYSRQLYSLPLRLIMSVIMVYVVLNNTKALSLNRKKTLILLFILFWILYFIKVVYCYNQGYPLFRRWFEYIFYAVNYCCLPFLMFASIDFNKYKNTILNALIFAGFIMACTCLYLYRSLLFIGLGRISDILYSDSTTEVLTPLALSYCGALTMILCLYKLFFENTSVKIMSKIYLVTAIIVSFWIFLLGSSRGSVVAIVICIPIFILYLPYRSKLKFGIGIIVLTPLILWATVRSGSSILDRVNNSIENSEINRGELWISAWREFIDYPLLGNRIEIDFYPHNFILETLMSTGFVGFFLLFIVLITAIVRVYKISFIDKKYIVLFVILLQGLAFYSFSGAIYFATLVFMPLGMIYSSYNEPRNLSAN
jgi:hypothetical protein